MKKKSFSRFPISFYSIIVFKVVLTFTYLRVFLSVFESLFSRPQNQNP